MAVGDKKPVVMEADIGASGGVAEYDATQTALATKTPVYGKGVNLLDNWYFANPVNQRGQTEYTGAGYGIDCWWISPSVTAVVGASGITLSGFPSVITDTMQNFAQKIPMEKLRAGVYTASILTADGRIGSVTGAWDGLSADKEFYVKDFGNTGFRCNLRFGWNNKAAHLFGIMGNGTLAAAKLELGDSQTLAHQDADGNWVLNDPPPNYGTELAKCQRYQFPISNAERLAGSTYNGNVNITIPTPVEMRTNPTCEAISFSLVYGDGTSEIITVTGGIKEANVITVSVPVNKSGTNVCVAIPAKNFLFDANL